MSVEDLESAVTKLSPGELSSFSEWFENFVADAWDKQIEADAKSGKLDKLGKQADREFESGGCTEL